MDLATGDELPFELEILRRKKYAEEQRRREGHPKDVPPVSIPPWRWEDPTAVAWADLETLYQQVAARDAAMQEGIREEARRLAEVQAIRESARLPGDSGGSGVPPSRCRNCGWRCPAAPATLVLLASRGVLTKLFPVDLQEKGAQAGNANYPLERIIQFLVSQVGEENVAEGAARVYAWLEGVRECEVIQETR